MAEISGGSGNEQQEKAEQLRTTFESMGGAVSGSVDDLAGSYARRILEGEDPASLNVSSPLRPRVAELVNKAKNEAQKINQEREQEQEKSAKSTGLRAYLTNNTTPQENGIQEDSTGVSENAVTKEQVQKEDAEFQQQFGKGWHTFVYSTIQSVAPFLNEARSFLKVQIIDNKEDGKKLQRYLDVLQAWHDAADQSKIELRNIVRAYMYGKTILDALKEWKPQL